MRKISIEPFSEVWYGTCFMHAILPILRYYGVDLTDFLKGEDIIYFTYNNTIQIGLEKVQNIHYYLGKINYKISHIHCEYKEIIRIIENYINNRIPVIIWVDGFNLSRRSDTYHKVHLIHCLLVYGYDSDTSELFIFDHDHVNSKEFFKRRISYEECQYCMQKYVENFDGKSYISLITKSSNTDNFPKEFESIKENKEKFWASVEDTIKQFQFENFEMLFEFFGHYERLLKAKQYACKADYSNEIKYSSLIKMLFGKATHYMTISPKNQDAVLDLYNKMIVT